MIKLHKQVHTCCANTSFLPESEHEGKASQVNKQHVKFDIDDHDHQQGQVYDMSWVCVCVIYMFCTLESLSH